MSELRWNAKEIEQEVRNRVILAIQKSAVTLQREIKMQLNKSASPSKPGEPPGKLTGALAQSIQVDLSKINNPQPEARVGTDLARIPYARIQEFGGTIEPKKGKFLVWKDKASGRLRFARKVTLPARPYMRPAIQLATPKIRDIFSKVLRGVG